jgi:hypothetical protein
MTFANPIALYGLSLLAIPIAIHLFNLRRAKKIYFSNVKLLSQIQTSTNTINQLRSLLVLLSRLLFILFLVLAFARPTTQKISTNPENEIGLILDNSLSMQNEQSGKPLFNLALNHLQKISSSYLGSTRFSLGVSGTWQQTDFYRLQEILTTVGYANTIPSLQSQLNKLKKKSNSNPSSIYIVSDFQKNTVGDLSELKLDTAVDYYMIPVLPESRENLAIDSIWLQTPYLQTNIPNSVWVRLKNYGSRAAENIPVNLVVNRVQSGSATVDLMAGSFSDIELPLLVKSAGIFEGKIEIQDPYMPFDNQFYFTVSVAQVVSVGHIAQSRNLYLESVFADSSFFEYTFFNPNNLNFSKLADTDLLIVENIDNPNTALIEEMLRALERGASVCIVPNSKNTPSQWQSLASYSSAASSYKMQLSAPDLNEPFFAGVFEELPNNSLMPVAKAILVPKAGRALLSLKDGTPFLTLNSVSKGKLYLFGSPLEPDFTDLPLNGLFVPTMFKMALFAVAANEKLAHRLDAQYASLPIKGLMKNDIFSLGKGGFIPEQMSSASALLISIPNLEVQAGSYALVRTKDDSTFTKVAFNYPKSESQTDYYSLDELTSIFSSKTNVKIIPEASASNIISKIDEAKQGIAYWKWLVFLAVLMLGIETLIIRNTKIKYKSAQ